MNYIFGLGNPGEEYAKNRHNAGRMAVDYFSKKYLPAGRQAKAKVIVPDTFMNLSGKAVAKIIKSKKAAENLIIVYDDIDLPLGTIKISFDKSSGGHNGLESVIKAVKTREFTRVRIGVAPATPKGKIKKPSGEDAVLKFLLGNFSPKETEILKKVFKTVAEALETILEDGRDKAMNLYN